MHRLVGRGNDHPDWRVLRARSSPVLCGTPLPGAHPARPARRAHAHGRGAPGAVQPRPGRSTTCARSSYFKRSHLPQRSHHGDLSDHRHRAADRGHRLGIFGLATFNVSTRTKQIGTRRAVGARRRDIVRYFLVENGLITSAGRRASAAPWRSVPATGCRSHTPCRAWTSITWWAACSPVGHRPARRLAAGAARRRGVALGRHPHGVSATAPLLAIAAMSSADRRAAAHRTCAASTILVIDDNEAVRTAFEVLLSLHGARVLGAATPGGGPGAARARAGGPRDPGHELPPRGHQRRGRRRAVPPDPRRASRRADHPADRLDASRDRGGAGARPAPPTTSPSPGTMRGC